MHCLKILAFSLIAVLLSGAADRTVSLESLAEAGHWKQIRSVIVQHAPGSEPENAYWSARVKHAFGDLNAADALIRRAISLDSKKAAYHLELSSILVEQISKAAGVFGPMGLARDARNELEIALSLEPKNVDVMQGLMEYYWNAPAIGGGDRKKAHELADRIAQANSLRGYLAQAKLSQMTGGSEIAKAEGLLKTAVESAPRNYDARAALTDFYLAQKNYSAADQEAQGLIAIAPDHARGYAYLSIVYAHEQKWEQLDQLLKQAEKAAPDDLHAYYQAGKTLLLEGHDYDRAERYLRKYLSQEPEGHEPSLAGAHWRLALVLEKKGKKSEAVAELQESLRIQPGYAPAQKDLDRLR